MTPPRLKVPAYSDPLKLWNFRKPDWKRFFLLTEEYYKRCPSPDTRNIEKACQELCESLLFAAKQCNSRSRRKNYMPCWRVIAPSSEPQWGLNRTEPLRPYFHGSIKRGRSDGKKLTTPSTSCTPVARREASSITHWQIWTLLSPVRHLSNLHRLTTREERGTQEEEPRVHQAYLSSYPIYGKSQHMRK